MSMVRRFLLFWYHFIVGDDWLLAAGVAVALSLGAIKTLRVIDWVLLPIVIIAMLAISVSRASRRR